MTMEHGKPLEAVTCRPVGPSDMGVFHGSEINLIYRMKVTSAAKPLTEEV